MKKIKVDIFSGFLGAGKTTLIKKLIAEAYKGEQLVLIENEFGEIGVDKSFLKNTGIEINELNAGCICCTLVGDFEKALEEVIDKFTPDRILIEPSGVGKLSDVMAAIDDLHDERVVLNGLIAVIDAKKCKRYLANFGEFYENQVEYATSLILSHTKDLSDAKIEEAISMLRDINKDAVIVTTDWDELDGAKILQVMEECGSESKVIEEFLNERAHDHNHDEHEHHHDHDHDEHEHRHHDHDEHEHHHHDHGETCSCGCHHEHGHHHADEVFEEFGIETAKAFTKDQIEETLDELEDDGKYGVVLRSKGILRDADGGWLEFDYVPGEGEVRSGEPNVSGIFCVIGTALNKENIKELFGINR